MQTKILFVYPNYESEFRIPLSVSILTAGLKQNGHRVEIFDTTFMVPTYNKDNELMEQQGLVEKTDLDAYVGDIGEQDIPQALLGKISDFGPDLIAVSLLERNYLVARDLLVLVKKTFPEIPIIAGGILPTIAPQMLIDLEWIDILCIGEGELPLVDLAGRIGCGQAYDGIDNLWVKQGGNVVKNKVRPLLDMDSVPYPDWSVFDERHMWKPFVGKVYKGGSFEFSRGCLNNCKFCVAPSLRNAQGGGKHYLRRKTIRRMIDEVKHMRKQYDLSMISFCDTNFLLLMTRDELSEFEQIWRQEVALPFTIQSEAKTIDEFTAAALKRMDCVAISIGVESGCADVRAKILGKHVSDEVIFRAFDSAKKHGIRTTANYMVGAPFETEEQIHKSIEFNLKLDPESIAVHHFTPFIGTELYDICLRKGFIKETATEADVYQGTIMNMPHISDKRIDELTQLFIDSFNNSLRNRTNTKL